MKGKSKFFITSLLFLLASCSFFATSSIEPNSRDNSYFNSLSSTDSFSTGNSSSRSSSDSSSGYSSQAPSSSSQINTYTVSWLNEDGTLLEFDDSVPEGSIPSYDGETPTKESTIERTYTFSGWDQELFPIYDDMVFIATYTDKTRTYVVTWIVDDKEVKETYEYGEMPVYKEGTPTKESDDSGTYYFSGWDQEKEVVSSDKTYTAVFSNKTIIDNDLVYLRVKISTGYKNELKLVDCLDKDLKNLVVPDYCQNIPVTSISFDDSDRVFDTIYLGKNVRSASKVRVLESYVVDSENKWLKSIEGMLCGVGSFLYKHPENIGEHLVVPEGVKELGNGIDLKRFSRLTLPSSFNFMGTKINELEEYIISENNESYCSVDGVMYSKDMKTLISYPARKSNKTFEVPSSVTSINSSAFINSKILETLILPDGLEKADCVMNYETNIKQYVVSENNNYFSSIDGVLYDKEKTTLIKCPPRKTGSTYTVIEGTQTISKYAFHYCKNLTEINFANSVRGFDVKIMEPHFSYNSYSSNPAFIGCSNLQVINLGSSFEAFKSVFLHNCSSIEEINVSSENEHYSSIDGVLFNKDRTEIIYFPSAIEEGYVIPEGVLNIAVNSFLESSVNNVSIPESVKTIEQYAFRESRALYFINIGKNIEEIGKYSFKNCRQLEAINVSDENELYCSKDGVLYSKNKTTLLIYPDGKKDENFILDDSVEGVANISFNNPYLKSITYSDNLPVLIQFGNKKIIIKETNKYFSSIDGIVYNKDQTELILCPLDRDKELVVPASVKKICEGAFSNCTNIPSVSIYHSLVVDQIAFSRAVTTINIGISPREVSDNWSSFWNYSDNVFVGSANTQLTIYYV
ncbi:MAG TPA: leucine-rich repeat protein [Erysipelotrichaceae bacterium]|nr:leucine-rich repeat protein [Erysipelotrichaceae bacterium]